jgi:hypothetical protein
MQNKRELENQRAVRILNMTSDMHLMVSRLYEHLVDSEYERAMSDAKSLIREIRLIQKLIEDEDF